MPATKTAKIDSAQIDNSEIGVLLSSFSELTGNLDSLSSKYKVVQHKDTEMLGMLDSYSKFKAVSKTFADYLALKDTLSKYKAVNKVMTEMLGMLDNISSKNKAVNKVFNERLGLKDFASYIFGPTHQKQYHDNPSQQIESGEE